MHALRRGSGDTGGSLRAPHAARLYNLGVDSFALSGLWPKAELGNTHGIRTWCILFCLQNGTLIRPASISGSLLDCSRTPVPGIVVQVRSMEEEAGSMEEAGSGHEI
jgi:hypothetical protein